MAATPITASAAGKGFTLIELIISMAIIVMLLGLGIPAFRRYGLRADLENAGVTLATNIFRARTLSLAPEASKEGNITAYGVAFDALNNKYRIARFSGEGANVQEESVVDQFLLPNQVAFSVAPAEPILFPLALQGEPAQLPADSNLALLHTRLAQNNSRTININQVTGQVSLEE